MFKRDSMTKAFESECVVNGKKERERKRERMMHEIRNPDRQRQKNEQGQT